MLGLKYAHVVLLFLITPSVNGLLPTINKSEDKDRITVRDELYNHTVHLTISNLQGRDIDVYHCEFYYGSLPEDKNIPGKMEFFIYVEDFCR
ncbi:hypothetical protein F2P79_025124 [Pimephales promelas]|nr:hypothetical protein F2P79_025124 [Pimephales promelas]